MADLDPLLIFGIAAVVGVVLIFWARYTAILIRGWPPLPLPPEPLADPNLQRIKAVLDAGWSRSHSIDLITDICAVLPE